MKSKLGTLYKDLFKEYKVMHSSKTGQENEEIFLALGAQAKAEHKSKETKR